MPGLKTSDTPISTSARGETDWDYFRFGTFLKVKLEPHGNNEFELILVVSSSLPSALIPERHSFAF